MAPCFEPSRFFLKGKVRQKKQATYINTLLVRCEMNTKEEDIKKESQVLVLGLHKRLNMNRGTRSFGWRKRL